MDLLIWITFGFIIIGLVVLISMKKRVENKVDYLSTKIETQESSAASKPIIWWLIGVVAWGIISMILIVSSFYTHFG